MDNIKVTFPDGSIKEFEKGISAYSIAESISPRLAEDTLAVKINDSIKDLNSSINSDSEDRKSVV